MSDKAVGNKLSQLKNLIEVVQYPPPTRSTNGTDTAKNKMLRSFVNFCEGECSLWKVLGTASGSVLPAVPLSEKVDEDKV